MHTKSSTCLILLILPKRRGTDMENRENSPLVPATGSRGGEKGKNFPDKKTSGLDRCTHLYIILSAPTDCTAAEEKEEVPKERPTTTSAADGGCLWQSALSTARHHRVAASACPVKRRWHEVQMRRERWYTKRVDRHGIGKSKQGDQEKVSAWKANKMKCKNKQWVMERV